MKRFILIFSLIAGIIVTQIVITSTVEAAHYFVHSSYTENYRGSANSKNNGVTRTTYVDSDNIGRYIDGGKFVKDQNQSGLKGGLFKVRVIEVWDWDVATQYHPKQQIFKKDYYFYRLENYGIKAYSVFDNIGVGYILSHNIPAIDIVMGLKGYGLRCLVPTWVKDGQDVYRDELVQANDDYSSDWYLYKIYEEARKIYDIKRN